MNLPLYPIGYVQKQTGLSARQIRYYEKKGLITPTRTCGKQRRYSKKDLATLTKIKELLVAGLGLDAIKVALADPTSPLSRSLEKNVGMHNASILTEKIQQRKLTSLYPVKNRAALEEILAEPFPKDLKIP